MPIRQGVDFVTELGKAAFKNPEGAGQVFTGLRNSLGPEQVDDLMGALLQQAKSAVQPPKTALQYAKDFAVGSIPIGLTVGGTALALGGLNKNNGETDSSVLDNSGGVQPPQQDSSNNLNTNPAPFTSGLVQDPTSIDDFYKQLFGLARDKYEFNKYQTSPGFLDAAQSRARDAKLAVNEQVLNSIEARTRENSRRQESISRINAWKTIEQETIRANKDIALGLASVAYQAGVPNAATLSALSPVVQAGAASFAPGASVLGSLRR